MEEHPEHPEQTNGRAGFQRSGYPEQKKPTRNAAMKGTRADFAKHLGVNRSTVTRAVDAGRIHLEADGTIDFEKATAAWHASAGGRADVAARHAAQRGSAIPDSQPGQKNAPAARFDEPGIDGLDSDGLADGQRAHAKALLMRFENEIIKIEMALRRGLRFERAAVRREAASLGATLRAGLERVIDQCAPRLAASQDATERRRVIEKETRRLRWIIKREIPRALRRMKDAGQGKPAGSAE